MHADNREKIAKLRNVTRARGATAGEEAAARAAIRRLLRNEPASAEFDDEPAPLFDVMERSISRQLARTALFVVAAGWLWMRAWSRARG